MRGVDGVEIVYPVEINAVFARIPREWLDDLEKEFFFATVDPDEAQVRWMSGFDTTMEDVANLSDLVQWCSKEHASP